MPDRQAVDFLRRRYAAAILRDDLATACRLRSQLDRIMNQRPQRFDRSPRIEVRAPETRAPSPEGPTPPVAGRFQPRVLVAEPVTGLLERPRFLPQVARAGAAPDLA
jgi:hypothetical protein